MLKNPSRNADRSRDVSVSLADIDDARLLELKREAYRRFYLRPRFIVSSLRDLYPLKKWSYFVKDVWTFVKRNFF